MSDKKEIELHLLSDEPTDIDEFQSHEKVAKSISALILREQKGKTVALTGNWGSGKSSIVTMAKKELGEACEVLEFNAWIHQGDPLRRSFLETIINHFIEINWVDSKKWKEKIEELAKRKEETDTTNRYKPTLEGIFFILLTLLVPVAITMVSKFMDIWTKWPDTAWIIFGISIIVASAPFLYALIYFCKDKEKFLSILIEKSDKKTETKTYRTLDPTSIEFQKMFHELMTSAYKNLEAKKILIVIDNLDRVESDTALKIWSTIKMFFDNDFYKNEKWKDKLWVLVPFDFTALKKLWPNDNAIGVNSLAVSFAEKTFQVTFETPPPILTNWEKYFKSRFTEAFKGFSDKEELHRIFRMYKSICAQVNKPPTPREIKLFINELIPFYSQWGIEIPLHIQALYVMLRRKRWKEENNIIPDLLNSESEFLSPLNPDILESDYKENLAALYFNVEKNTAVQLLISSPIEKAILKNDVKRLNNLKSYNGFSNVMEDVLENNYRQWSKEDPKRIGYIANTVSSLEISDSDSLLGCWELLKKGVIITAEYPVLDGNCSSGIAKIIDRNTKDAEFIEDIVSTLYSSSSLFEIKDKTNQTITTLKENELAKNLDSLGQLLNTVANLGYLDILKENFALNCSAQTYNEVMYQAIQDSSLSNLYKFFTPTCDIEIIMENLSERIEKGIFDNYKWVTLIQIYKTLEISWNWTDVITAIHNRVGNQSEPTPQEISILLEILIELNANENESN